MFVSTTHLLTLSGLFPILAISAAVQAPNGQSLFPSLANISSTAENSSLGLFLSRYSGAVGLGDREPQIRCDARLYGTPPSASCHEALRALTAEVSILGDPTLSIGPRDAATGGRFDINLPKRWIGSDGKCIMDLTQDGYPSHTRAINILAAGTIIQSECVDKAEPPYGGQAIHMADEDNLQFTTRSYTPPFIRCERAHATQRPVSKACQTIISRMEASMGVTKFGTRGVADVQEYLPQTLTEPTGQCKITIDTIAPQDQASWYDIWAAVIALDGMCARGGQTGKARFLGVNRKLVVTIAQ